MRKQSGFSLVELIVVVAIIGILASMVVPMYDRIVHRVRQSEGKTMLAGLHTAEKTFYSEFSAYHTAFQAIGFAPEGSIRYNVGFGDTGVVASEANGYRTPLPLMSLNSRAYCSGVGGADVPGNSCRMLAGRDNLPAPPLPSSLTATAGGYVAGAVMYTPPGYAFNEIKPELMYAAERGFGPLGTIAGFALLAEKVYARSGPEAESPDVCGPQDDCTVTVVTGVIHADIWMITESGKVGPGGIEITCASLAGLPGQDCSDPRFTPVTVGAGPGTN